MYFLQSYSSVSPFHQSLFDETLHMDGVVYSMRCYEVNYVPPIKIIRPSLLSFFESPGAKKKSGNQVCCFLCVKLSFPSIL